MAREHRVLEGTGVPRTFHVGIAARAAGGAMPGSGSDDAQRLERPLVDAARFHLAQEMT